MKAVRIFLKRLCCLITAAGIAVTGSPLPVSAQPVSGFPAVSAETTFHFPVLQGLKIDPVRPFELDFLFDAQAADARQDDYLTPVRDFLAAMAVPDGDLWVNLSPEEPDRIIPRALGTTETGRDLLHQDYLLKQLTASLLDPQNETGRAFWNRLHERAYAAGAGELSQKLLQRVWIVPDIAELYSHGNAVYITAARLKVLAQRKDMDSSSDDDDGAAEDLIQDILLPVIEDEVNTSEAFAPLRRIYHSVILAKWYKTYFKQTVLGRAWADRSVVGGMDTVSQDDINGIYRQYLEKFQKASGVILEEYDPVQQTIVPRRYLTGGADLQVTPAMLIRTLPAEILTAPKSELTINLAMMTDPKSEQEGAPPDLQKVGSRKLKLLRHFEQLRQSRVVVQGGWFNQLDEAAQESFRSLEALRLLAKQEGLAYQDKEWGPAEHLMLGYKNNDDGFLFPMVRIWDAWLASSITDGGLTPEDSIAWREVIVAVFEKRVFPGLPEESLSARFARVFDRQPEGLAVYILVSNTDPKTFPPLMDVLLERMSPQAALIYLDSQTRHNQRLLGQEEWPFDIAYFPRLLKRVAELPWTGKVAYVVSNVLATNQNPNAMGREFVKWRQEPAVVGLVSRLKEDFPQYLTVQDSALTGDNAAAGGYLELLIKNERPGVSVSSLMAPKSPGILEFIKETFPDFKDLLNMKYHLQMNLDQGAAILTVSEPTEQGKRIADALRTLNRLMYENWPGYNLSNDASRLRGQHWPYDPYLETYDLQATTSMDIVIKVLDMWFAGIMFQKWDMEKARELQIHIKKIFEKDIIPHLSGLPGKSELRRLMMALEDNPENLAVYLLMSDGRDNDSYYQKLGLIADTSSPQTALFCLDYLARRAKMFSPEESSRSRQREFYLKLWEKAAGIDTDDRVAPVMMNLLSENRKAQDGSFDHFLRDGDVPESIQRTIQSVQEDHSKYLNVQDSWLVFPNTRSQLDVIVRQLMYASGGPFTVSQLMAPDESMDEFVENHRNKDVRRGDFSDMQNHMDRGVEFLANKDAEDESGNRAMMAKKNTEDNKSQPDLQKVESKKNELRQQFQKILGGLTDENLENINDGFHSFNGPAQNAFRSLEALGQLAEQEGLAYKRNDWGPAGGFISIYTTKYKGRDDGFFFPMVRIWDAWLGSSATDVNFAIEDSLAWKDFISEVFERNVFENLPPKSISAKAAKVFDYHPESYAAYILANNTDKRFFSSGMRILIQRLSAMAVLVFLDALTRHDKRFLGNNEWQYDLDYLPDLLKRITEMEFNDKVAYVVSNVLAASQYPYQMGMEFEAWKEHDHIVQMVKDLKNQYPQYLRVQSSSLVKDAQPGDYVFTLMHYEESDVSLLQMMAPEGEDVQKFIEAQRPTFQSLFEYKYRVQMNLDQGVAILTYQGSDDQTVRAMDSLRELYRNMLQDFPDFVFSSRANNLRKEHWFYDPYLETVYAENSAMDMLLSLWDMWFRKVSSGEWSEEETIEFKNKIITTLEKDLIPNLPPDSEARRLMAVLEDKAENLAVDLMWKLREGYSEKGFIDGYSRRLDLVIKYFSPEAALFALDQLSRLVKYNPKALFDWNKNLDSNIAAYYSRLFEKIAELPVNDRVASVVMSAFAVSLENGFRFKSFLNNEAKIFPGVAKIMEEIFQNHEKYLKINDSWMIYPFLPKGSSVDALVKQLMAFSPQARISDLMAPSEFMAEFVAENIYDVKPGERGKMQKSLDDAVAFFKKALAASNPAMLDPGGIDLNDVSVQVNGAEPEVSVPADAAMMDGSSVIGIRPQIIGMKVLPLYGFLELPEPDGVEVREQRVEMRDKKRDILSYL